MGADTSYWLVPVGPAGHVSAKAVVADLVGEHHIFALTDTARARSRVAVGDWLCFYGKSTGIIAHARAASSPVLRTHPAVPDARFRWIIEVEEDQLYLDDPVILDPELRGRLDTLRGKTAWTWLVHTIGRLTEADFRLLTRSVSP